MQTKRYLCASVAIACTLLTAGSARAQFSEISRGLYLAGFQIDATKNPITKGVDFRSSRSFFPGSNTLNFGVGTLTLNGQLGFDGSFTRRPIPGVSFGVHSTTTPGGTAQPLAYTLTIPRAVESLTVTGQVTIDTNITVDETGFYHRVIRIDNRGTVVTDGAVDTTNNIDFTLGPIDQKGNIFLEGLSSLTGGGKGGLFGNLTNASASKAIDLSDVESLDLNDPEQLKAYVNAALVEGITEAAMDPSLGSTSPMMVPEPATLTLLALAGAMCMVGVRRHRTAA